MKKFIIQTGIFFLPFLFLIGLYFLLDPFKVLYKYDSYFDASVDGCVFLNTNYVSTTNFDNHYDEFQYNSFIFGSSRAFFYPVSHWKKHIGNEPAYHFETGGEALYSIHKKVSYLDHQKIPIKNALLVLDYDILIQDEPKDGHMGLPSPQLENYRNFFEFHLANIKGFFNIEFLYAFLDFSLSGKVKPYMTRNFLIEHRPFTYDFISNEIQFTSYEKLISKGKYYTEDRMQEFYQRDSVETYSPPCIYENQKKMLDDIQTIFKTHKTNYKIIISPLYNQVRLAEEDISYLRSLFGESSVYDFSGINDITANYMNYYESSHYRPHVAKLIIDSIYGNDSKQQVSRTKPTVLKINNQMASPLK